MARVLRPDGGLHPLSLLIFWPLYLGGRRPRTIVLNSVAFQRDRYLALPFLDAPARLGLEGELLSSWGARGWRLVLEPRAVSAHAAPASLRELWQTLAFNGNAYAESWALLNRYNPVRYWLAAVKRAVGWTGVGLLNLIGNGRRYRLGARTLADALLMLALTVPAYLYGTYCHARGVTVPDI